MAPVSKITIVSVAIHAPIYYEVRLCADRVVDNTEVSVVAGEDPIKKIFAAIFLGWTLDFRGCRGSLETDRIECPKGSEQANVVITTYCPYGCLW